MNKPKSVMQNNPHARKAASLAAASLFSKPAQTDMAAVPDIKAITETPPTPQVDQSMLLRGLEAQNAGRVDEAEAIFRAYLEQVPFDGVATYSLSLILMRRGQGVQAIQLVYATLQKNPGFAPLWMALGSLMQGHSQPEQALIAYDNAIKLNPQYAEALINSGVLLREAHKHLEALERFQRILSFKPDHESALGNSGIILSEFKRHKEASKYFEQLLRINADYEYGWGLLAYERLQDCDWRDFDAMSHLIVEGLKAGKRTCKSLGLMAISDDAKAHQMSSQMFGDRFPAAAEPLWRGGRYRHKKIRLAYLSPDLREHPVGHLMAGIIERHDRSRFELIAVSLGIDDGSRIRQRMVKAFDHFIDGRLKTSMEIANLLKAMEVDVLVDLAGYTADSRTDVLARRPAPVQVNYLGYPGTMGQSYVDYIIADQHVIPPDHHQYFTEKVVYLPDTYLPAPADLELPEHTPSRSEYGLPENAFVFCSFCNDFKITPHIFGVWMRLLKQVEGSVLWLATRNEASQNHLREAAAREGIDPARLVYAGRVPKVEDHLVRYRQADLFLDTQPYNAHTTAADALMAGLPVVTHWGGAFPARVAGSVLCAAGLPELVAEDLAGYEALALNLARDPERLQAIRTKLRTTRAQQPLFDAEAHCRNLEAIYVSMWRRAELGAAHDALSPA
ncbi:MAG: tetratricopeptide repeat protein [Burkholderiaceae bacterium]|nr:tetratricopeptide repeat protein [Burkholderiaceae bacterium]